MRPFLPPVIWGIVIAIALYPWYRKLATYLGERRRLTAVLCTVVLLVILIVPIWLLTGTLVEGIQTMAARMKAGTLNVPPPPPTVANWPIVGTPVNRV